MGVLIKDGLSLCLWAYLACLVAAVVGMDSDTCLDSGTKHRVILQPNQCLSVVSVAL